MQANNKYAENLTEKAAGLCLSCDLINPFWLLIVICLFTLLIYFYFCLLLVLQIVLVLCVHFTSSRHFLIFPLSALLMNINCLLYNNFRQYLLVCSAVGEEFSVNNVCSELDCGSQLSCVLNKVPSETSISFCVISEFHVLSVVQFFGGFP